MDEFKWETISVTAGDSTSVAEIPGGRLYKVSDLRGVALTFVPTDPPLEQRLAATLALIERKARRDEP